MKLIPGKQLLLLELAKAVMLDFLESECTDGRPVINNDPFKKALEVAENLRLHHTFKDPPMRLKCWKKLNQVSFRCGTNDA